MSWSATINNKSTTLENSNGFKKCICTSQILQSSPSNTETTYSSSQKEFKDICTVLINEE